MLIPPFCGAALKPFAPSPATLASQPEITSTHQCESHTQTHTHTHTHTHNLDAFEFFFKHPSFRSSHFSERDKNFNTSRNLYIYVTHLAVPNLLLKLVFVTIDVCQFSMNFSISFLELDSHQLLHVAKPRQVGVAHLSRQSTCISITDISRCNTRWVGVVWDGWRFKGQMEGAKC